MKKILFICGFYFLIGCSEKEEYEQTILEQMKAEKDVVDYKINPQTMTDCVVSTSSGKMPGLLPIDPERRQAYKSYIKMLTLNKANNPTKVLDELRTEFGSPKNLSEAHSNYAESVVNCLSGLVTGAEKEQ